MATYTSNYAWTKPSGGDPVDIEVLNDNLDDQDSIVHQAFLDLAPVFSTANTYAVKDVVLYDNKVWICHTAVTTAGAWTGSTNWTQTTVGETGGVATYADLPDKPSINGNELSGNKTGAQLGLQNTLTFDNVPTANSTNPVKSGGVYSADEAIRQWTTAEAKSVSGNPITLTDGSARNAEGLVVTLEPKQSGSGTPSPTNVRPITGLTECVVDRDGKNKLPVTVLNLKAINTSGTWNGNVYTVNGVTFTLNTDANGNIVGITAKGTATANVTLFLKKGTLPEFNGMIMNGGYNNSCYIIFTRDSSPYAVFAKDTGSGATISIPSEYNNDDYRIYIRIENGYALPTDGIVFKPMIRDATESADFEPYSHYTATITFGQTVYGGSVDFKSGKVTVTHGYITLDGNARTNYGFKNYWESATDYTKYLGRTSNNVGNRRAVNISTDIVAISDKFNGAPYATITTVGNICTGATLDDAIYINFGEASGLDTTEKQLAWLAQNPVHVCYELATPIELTLTPAELELLKGYNYITTNGTTIALDYLPNSLLAEAENYVDAKIPPAPSSDGTYVLTCTVTDGTPAYSWESAT